MKVSYPNHWTIWDEFNRELVDTACYPITPQEFSLPPGIEPGSPAYNAFNLIAGSLFLNASGGIRTHEAEAQDLKTCPFDRSGTLAQIKFADLINAP